MVQAKDDSPVDRRRITPEISGHMRQGDDALSRAEVVPASEHDGSAFGLSSGVDQRLGQASAHRSVGDRAFLRGNLDGAARHYGTALDLYGQVLDRAGQAH